MSGSVFGKNFTVSTWGESHGKAVGVCVDGCPAGIKVDEEYIQSQLDRRKPGTSEFVTKRNEKDKVHILSGVFEGKTTGTPITKISIQRITITLKTFTDRDTQISHLIQSTVLESEITEVAEDLQEERQ